MSVSVFARPSHFLWSIEWWKRLIVPPWSNVLSWSALSFQNGGRIVGVNRRGMRRVWSDSPNVPFRRVSVTLERNMLERSWWCWSLNQELLIHQNSIVENDQTHPSCGIRNIRESHSLRTDSSERPINGIDSQLYSRIVWKTIGPDDSNSLHPSEGKRDLICSSVSSHAIRNSNTLRLTFAGQQSLSGSGDHDANPSWHREPNEQIGDSIQKRCEKSGIAPRYLVDWLWCGGSPSSWTQTGLAALHCLDRRSRLEWINTRHEISSSSCTKNNWLRLQSLLWWWKLINASRDSHLSVSANRPQWNDVHNWQPDFETHPFGVWEVPLASAALSCPSAKLALMPPDSVHSLTTTPTTHSHSRLAGSLAPSATVPFCWHNNRCWDQVWADMWFWFHIRTMRSWSFCRQERHFNDSCVIEDNKVPDVEHPAVGPIIHSGFFHVRDCVSSYSGQDGDHLLWPFCSYRIA
jgi:hypothetical protein